MNAGGKRTAIILASLGLIGIISIALTIFVLLRLTAAPPSEPVVQASPTLPSTPSPGPIPTQPPALNTATPPVATATTAPDEGTAEPTGDDLWAEIQERGTLVVGTAPDYPPFAYYMEEFELTGFDIALAEAIGRRLGVEIEMRDLAFDGLAGALEVGQIDLAIAAISVTAEREALVGFSRVYFVSEDAILARSDNPTTINALEELAPFRVGVQNASVFQNWLQTNLITPGLMPADRLLVYSEIDEAVVDLRDGRIDFIVGDLLPAQVAAATGDFTIAGQGINRQHFAAATRHGSTLLEPLNEALAEMERDGTLAELVETHLGLSAEETLPLPTPLPTPALPPNRTNFGCIDAMALVRDLSFDDQNMQAPVTFTPGQSFTKGWRVQNVGTCTWNNAYMLVYASGNDPAARMGGQPFVISDNVAPGEETDLSLNLVAPLVSGDYQGFWSLRAGNGLLFGERLSIGIRVEAAATPTPQPTSPPSPDVSFTADASELTAGECTTFRWQVENATNVYFYAAGEPWQLNEVATTGAQQECPPVTTTYELRILLADGTADIRQQRIDVQPPPIDAPQITSFAVTPDFQIIVGQCLQLTWRVTGEIEQVRLLRNDVALWDSAPLSGGLTDCPPSGNGVYVLEATGPGGVVRAQREVTVVESSAATATAVPPTPTGPAAPVINSFSVRPGRLQSGQCVTINWSAGGGATRVQITRNGSLLLDNGPLTGAATDCLANSGTYTYRIEALNAADQVTFQQAAVTVDQPTANNPLLGSWTLVSLNGLTLPPTVVINAIFGDNGNLSGNAGCNHYSTFYQINNSSLLVGPYSLGQNVCTIPPDIMQLEAQYLSALQSADRFAIDGDELTISGPGALIFIRD